MCDRCKLLSPQQKSIIQQYCVEASAKFQMTLTLSLALLIITNEPTVFCSIFAFMYIAIIYTLLSWPPLTIHLPLSTSHLPPPPLSLTSPPPFTSLLLPSFLPPPQAFSSAIIDITILPDGYQWWTSPSLCNCSPSYPISFCLLFQLYVITFFHAVDLCDNAKTCIVTVGLNYHHHDNHDNTM